EASALFHGFMSYCENGGIAQISNRYIGGSDQSAIIDGVEIELPNEYTWRMLEYHELQALWDFQYNGYWYDFHHWSHLTPSGAYIDDDHFFPFWAIFVPAEWEYHIYRAYFTGGPY